MNDEKISFALHALLNRDNDDAFVILEEKKSRKFVQFAGSSQQPLLLDLPHQTLTADEEMRVQVLFREFDSNHAARTDLYNQPEGRVVGRQMSYQLEFGRDYVRASEVARRIFAEVYLFPREFDLIITEN